MLEIVRQRLAIKLGLLITVAVAAGFTLAATARTSDGWWRSSRHACRRLAFACSPREGKKFSGRSLRCRLRGRGLRQKLELSKFVSHDTLREVEANVGAVARSGERRRIAVVFSDIRGFTAFSESHEPEAVVAMLNRYLHAQAEVVVRHGGDIDKFVGDQIMARFTGPDMALRTSRAAVDMVAVVKALDSARAGEADRAAAGSGEVLVTEAVRRELLNVTELELSALEPMHLKGKHEAVAVYRVTPRRTVA